MFHAHSRVSVHEGPSHAEATNPAFAETIKNLAVQMFLGINYSITKVSPGLCFVLGTRQYIINGIVCAMLGILPTNSTHKLRSRFKKYDKNALTFAVKGLMVLSV